MTMYDRIRKLRKEQDMSQEDLARKVGYKGRSMIARVESGQVDLSQSKIKAFANALNTSIDYLMDDTYPIHPDVIQMLEDRANVTDEDRELKKLWENASTAAKRAALAVLRSMQENGG